MSNPDFINRLLRLAASDMADIYTYEEGTAFFEYKGVKYSYYSDSDPASVTGDYFKLEDPELLLKLHCEIEFFFSTYDGTQYTDSWFPCLNLNDVFGYACADAEALPLEDLPVIEEIYTKFGWYGLVAWVEKRRGYPPIKERQKLGYFDAKKFLGLA